MTSLQPTDSNRVLTLFIYFGIFWYVLIATVNYLNARPLWNDEQAVFLSVQAYSMQDMFGKPLDAIQVFPRLYLFLIQKFSALFDYHVLSLRFPSFVCMMAAFVLWLRLAKYELQNKVEYLTFVLSWTASSMLLYYAAELKQYSMDVLAGAIYLTFFYAWRGQKEKGVTSRHSTFLIKNVECRDVTPFSLLPFLGWFSYTSYLFALVVLYNLIVAVRRKEMAVSYLLVFVSSLAVALTCSYFFDMRFRHSQEVTAGFGDYFISFASVGEFFRTFGEGVNNLFSRWLVDHPRMIKAMGRFFMVFGILYLFYAFFANFKKEKYRIWSLNTIAFTLFLGLVGLGALHAYPFTVPRTALFYCPIVLYLVVKGIASLKGINRYVYGVVQTLYLIWLIFLTLGLSRLAFTGQSLFLDII